MFCFIVEHVVRQARVTGGKRKQLEDSDHGGISGTNNLVVCMHSV